MLHALIGSDATSSINEAGKATVFKKLLSNKQLQEVALVFSAGSKSHEEIESTGKKAVSIIPKSNTDHLLNFLSHKQLNLERN